MSEDEHRMVEGEHHHEEECDCGHEHEHEHHHHSHEEECSCGHDHEHHHHDEESDCCEHDHEHHHHDHDHHNHDHHNHEDHDDHHHECGHGWSLDSHVHDGAAVTSLVLTVNADASQFGVNLQKQMEILASKIDQAGGIIGHVKATLEIRHIEMYSVTYLDVMKKQGTLPELVVKMAAIVYMDEDKLIPLVKELKDALCPQ